MASSSKVITVRMHPADIAIIQGHMADMGFRSLSDFMRAAAAEKLERTRLSSFVEEHIQRLEERQKKLEKITIDVLKMADQNASSAVKLTKKIGDDLAILASKIG